ncbi:MAG: pyridoxal-phosphate dependent enzyme [Desulfamplus sp.]|nr:pyridoxal-phosphate dependent enzyme [Desulfamplus sp.]
MSYSIIDSIGNTPLVEIKRLNPVKEVRILAKLEYLNPGGSIKDRAALSMIEDGERSGKLTKDKIVVEATSGNTGIGLAMICSVKGYKILLTMSESASEERKSILRARGAEIMLTPAHRGSDGAIEEAYRLARENPDKYFMTDQYNNEANWKAHYNTTAVEIWNQTNGEVNAIVATLGTSGTLMGLSRRLKEFNPKIRIIGVEPFLGHGIQGLKNMKESYRPDIFDKKRLDEKINIEDGEAFEAARLLAREEGLFVGMSSGAAMAVALKEALKIKDALGAKHTTSVDPLSLESSSGKGEDYPPIYTIVVILPDSGERYLSTSLFKFKDNITLNIFNTIERKIVKFEPLVQGKVSVYTCGPTVHRPLDPSLFRRFVCADLLCRYLEYRKLSVNHVVNITDMDDKTIQGSEKEGLTLSEFTDKYIKLFKDDLRLLRVREAQSYPKVSDNLDSMVNLASTLVEKGFAYEKLNSLYFNLSALSDYGELSGVDLDKIRVGATVDLDDYEKDHPRDFTLLKRVGLSELKRGVCINTKWGNVRPSLHLQCAAITKSSLGEQFDIHTGSRELLFPHHENEVAISLGATGKSPARYWMHCESVQYDGTLIESEFSNINTLSETENKNSFFADKLENFTLKKLMDMGWRPREIRFWLLSTHYRKILVLSKKALLDARRSLDKLDRCVGTLLEIKNGTYFNDDNKLDKNSYDTSNQISKEKLNQTGKDSQSKSIEQPFEIDIDIEQLIYDLKHGFSQAMDDDFKITDIFALIFKTVRNLNRMIDNSKIGINGHTFNKNHAASVLDMFHEIDDVLQIFDFNQDRESSALWGSSPEIKKLIDEREAARKNKDWGESDRIRDKLLSMGVEVRDGKI